jgi:hypothetical protein
MVVVDNDQFAALRGNIQSGKQGSHVFSHNKRST